MNASGTKLQLNGAAYGSGVYVSVSVSTTNVCLYFYVIRILISIFYPYDRQQHRFRILDNTRFQIQLGNKTTSFWMEERIAFAWHCAKVSQSNNKRYLCVPFDLLNIYLSICQVIDKKGQIHKPCDTIWVVKDQDLICTRFFFVYKKRPINMEQCVTTNSEFREQIDHAMKSI